MISRKQAKANRRNALVSTGPRTVEGKVVSSRNATRHGLLSHLEVLPHLETAKEWESHLRRTIADLRPIGYIELALAQRIALKLWLLRRVTRFERDVAAFAMEMTAGHSLSGGYHHLHMSLKEQEELADLVRRLPGLPDEEKIDQYLAAEIVVNVADSAGVDLWGDEKKRKAPDIALPGGVSEVLFHDILQGPAHRPMTFLHCRRRQIAYLEELDWDVLLLRKVLASIADYAGRKLSDLLAQEEGAAQMEADKARRDKELVRRLNALPDLDKLEKINRYETSLERSLFRNLHELLRLQAARSGETVSPPAVVDVTIDGFSTARPGFQQERLLDDREGAQVLPVNGFVSQKK